MLHISLLSPKWRQRLAASLAAVATVCVGTLEGWTSPALPYLQQIDNDSRITEEEASWIGSLCGVGALFGSLPAGLLADKLGRRTLLLGLTLPFMLGWIIIILAQKSVVMLYSARFILGLSAGAVTVAVPMYTEEISEINIRGELGSYLELSITIGLLYVYALGVFIPYIWLCVSSILLPVLFAVTFFCMPESPMYLLSKGRNIEAEKSLRWFRNVGKLDNPNIDVELRGMEETLKKISSCEQSDNCKFFRNISTRSPVCKALILMLGLMSLQQLCGINGVLFYTVEIFQVAGSALSPYICTLIVGVVQVILTYTGAVLVDKIGRRILLLTSGLGMSISLLILVVFFTLKEQGWDMTVTSWIPVVALNLYIISFCLGFGPIPWFMIVELSTSETKGWMSSVAVFDSWAMLFLVTKVFPIMLTQLGQAVTYGILCIVCVLGSVFVFLFVPETKGKSRDEIQAILAGK